MFVGRVVAAVCVDSSVSVGGCVGGGVVGGGWGCSTYKHRGGPDTRGRLEGEGWGGGKGGEGGGGGGAEGLMARSDHSALMGLHKGSMGVRGQFPKKSENNPPPPLSQSQSILLAVELVCRVLTSLI